MTRSLFAAAVVAAALLQPLAAPLTDPLAAQSASDDVELLGRIHGTRPPDSYYELKLRNPNAFRLARGWMRRNPGLERTLQASGAAPSARAEEGAVASLLGPRGPVQGTFRFPLVLGLFSDSPEVAPFSQLEVQREYFDGPNTYYRTIPDLYSEMSGGLATLVGETHDWVRTGLTRTQVAANQSGLPGRVGDFILQVLSGLGSSGIDWGSYDNDGLDGVPNSGDDDGFVDLLAVMHPTQGAECDGSKTRVWSHKWTLQDAVRQHYVTTTPAAGGGFIRIDDYTIQPVYACPPTGTAPERINEIGVFAHELGHGFGLPDLYNTGSSSNHAGIGSWGLMGSGSWGCYGFHPERPCHMEAWSKAMLGWVDVEQLAQGLDLGVLSLPPVLSSGKVFRIDAADGSGDYFLLENRQRLGFDLGLVQPGLLVWRIDEQRLAQSWPFNNVNTNASRPGVGLRQADGLDQLATSGGGRGDPGDPFPGSSGRTVFHAGSAPASLSHTGEPSGLTVLDIAQVGDEMRFRLLTRFQTLTLLTQGASGGGSIFTVDGVDLAPGETVTRAAPFQTLLVEAAAGELLEPGVRRGFEQWLDAPSEPRQRTWVAGLEDAELVAGYGRREIQASLFTHGEQFGVQPGEVRASPESADFWFPEGTLVTFSAEPTTGFAFEEWTGALAGQGNPASFQINAPMIAAAVFGLVYGVPGEVEHAFEAATAQEIQLEAAHASAPVEWTLLSGVLPEGMSFSGGGTLSGGALETGEFTIEVSAKDARGLEASGQLVLRVGSPTIGVEALTAQFLLGTLGLNELQTRYLDIAGNGNGFYDLGDFRAFLLDHPSLPMTVQQQALVRTVLPVVDLGPAGRPQGGRP